MRLVALALLIVPAAVTPNQINQGQMSDYELETAKSLTVMINATIDGNTRPGAGIIFRLANNQVYIATANHLVRQRTSAAGEIRVRFKWLPGQWIPAQLLTTYDDRALDLAVIVVESSKAHVDPARLPAPRVGDPAMLKRGVALSAIGYPNGADYRISSAEVTRVETILLKYSVQGLVPGGYSGGPLVDRNGMIVGMIRQDQPPDAESDAN